MEHTKKNEVKFSIELLTCDVFMSACMDRDIFKKFTASRDVDARSIAVTNEYNLAIKGPRSYGTRTHTLISLHL
jgi:hypothetical protein